MPSIRLHGIIVVRALLSQAEAEGCLARLAEAAAVVGDGRRAAVEAVYDELETGLVLLGSTAVEDLPASPQCAVTASANAASGTRRMQCSAESDT